VDEFHLWLVIAFCSGAIFATTVLGIALVSAAMKREQRDRRQR
jgi:hypothetical protein